MTSLSRHWRMGCLALAIALVALPAGSALADGGSSTHPNINLTFKAKHGWQIDITGYNCGATGSAVNVIASKTGTHYTFTHTYYAPRRKSGCSGSTTLNSGKLHAYWGKLLRLKMTVKGAGARTTIPTPKGCTGTLGHQRAIKAHGTLRMTIHRGTLGRIDLTHAKGLMELFDTSKNFHCSGQGPKSTYAVGRFGSHYLFASKNDHTGSTSVNASGSDRLGYGVFESWGDMFSGALFTFNQQLTSAKIGSITGFMSGSVSFTGTAQCSPGWENGFWKSGTLKVHDGLTKATFVGAASASGSVYKSTAPYCTAP